MFSLASLPPSPRHKHPHKMGQGRPGKAGRAAQVEQLPAHMLSSITGQEMGASFTTVKQEQTPFARLKTPRAMLLSIARHRFLPLARLICWNLSFKALIYNKYK